MRETLIVQVRQYNRCKYGKTRNIKAVWPDCEALTFDLETWNLQGQVTDKGPNGNNS